MSYRITIANDRRHQRFVDEVCAALSAAGVEFTATVVTDYEGQQSDIRIESYDPRLEEIVSMVSKRKTQKLIRDHAAAKEATAQHSIHFGPVPELKAEVERLRNRLTEVSTERDRLDALARVNGADLAAASAEGGK
jgi:hypothetical protein